MSVRELMLQLAKSEVEQSGTGFKLQAVVDQAGVTMAMVNHYFGNRDRLLAEAAFLIYEEYISSLWQAVLSAPATPEARLGAWISRQINFQAEKKGWSVIFNYPAAVPGVAQALNEQFGERVHQLFELNIARLTRLVIDVAEAKVTEVDYQIGDYPRAELLADREAVAKASSIAWSALGASIWAAGEHMPSQSTAEIVKYLDGVTAVHVSNLIASVPRRY